MADRQPIASRSPASPAREVPDLRGPIASHVIPKQSPDPERRQASDGELAAFIFPRRR